MPSSSQLFLNNKPADAALAGKVAQYEVEENADMPGALEITLPLAASKGEPDFINDAGLQPLARVALLAQAASGRPECIFDGVVLSHRLHLKAGLVNSTLRVWCQDYSWMMNMEDKTKEWADVTDAVVANNIFGQHGVAPDPANLDDDSPAHTSAGHSLMQRASDAAFLRNLARRAGKLFRVVGGAAPGAMVGVFARPRLDAAPVATLTLTDKDKWNVSSLDLDWDATRPTKVKARQKLFSDTGSGSASGDTADTGLAKLGARDLAGFTGKPMTVLLTVPVDDGGELALRARALLAESGWFVRCEGTTDLGKLGTVLRVGQIVQLAGLGSVHSGKYYVWSVRHTITQDSHQMRFVLLRNAVGDPPAGGSGLGGLLGL
jgi:phage protein D